MMAKKQHTEEHIKQRKAEFEKEFEKLRPFLKRKRLIRTTTADKWGFDSPATEETKKNKYYSVD